MAKRKKAYSSTQVTINKSRDDIEEVLRNWGVQGIQWEDDFKNDRSILRFRWLREEDEKIYVARFILDFEPLEDIKKRAIDQRNNKFSKLKFERLIKYRGKREHRLLYMFLKNTFEAVSQGIIQAEAVFLPWLEDGEGVTLFERIAPVMGSLGAATLPKALMESKKEDEKREPDTD